RGRGGVARRLVPLRLAGGPAEATGDLGGGVADRGGQGGDAGGRDAEARARGADRGDHRALRVPDRGRDGGQAGLELVHRGGEAAPAHLGQQGRELGHGGDGASGE